MLVSFNLNNPVVVTFNFTVNTMDLRAAVINGSKCALQSVLGLVQESMFKELWKHDEYDPEYGQNDVTDEWTEICKNLQKKHCWITDSIAFLLKYVMLLVLLSGIVIVCGILVGSYSMAV